MPDPGVHSSPPGPPLPAGPGAGALPDGVLAWLGDPGPKGTLGDQHAGDPAATLALALPVARRLGMTRVADITGLDDLGIPVAAAYRPNARSLAVSGGKGPTPGAARASAVMEAVETAHAERPGLPLHLASPAELAGEGAPFVRPADLPRLPGPAPDDHADLLWVPGLDLATGAATRVPYDAVHLDLSGPPGGHDGCARPTSNGLASGLTLAEALAHALCELVERDAAALWEAAGPVHQATTRTDPATVDDPTARRLLDRCAAAGLDVALYDLTSDLGLPVVACHLAERDPNPFRPLPAAGGIGCHPHPGTAAVRAVTEAAQSRLIDIAGARDDLFRADHAARVDPDGPFTVRLPPLPAGARRFPTGPGVATPTMAGDVALLVARLTAAGLTPVVVDLSRPGTGIAVVRAVVPGLEGPPAAMAGDGVAPGPRARAAAAGQSAAPAPGPAPATRPDPTPAAGLSAVPTSGRAPAPRPGPTPGADDTSPHTMAPVVGRSRVDGTRGAARPVVFAGPTIPAGEVTARLDADVRPPAGQGDLARAAAGRPAAIVLIDGVYQGVPAVWHKEVLWALARGVPVYGAASMGALRAAELADFGMVGVGTVFDDLRAGRIVADDEVAVAHAGPEDGFAPLSVALVDIRATLAAAVAAGVVDEGAAGTVAQAAGRLFYPQRVWPGVLAAARRAGLPDTAASALRPWVVDQTVSRKRADAEAVLDRVRHDLAAATTTQPSAATGWRLARTDQWRRVEAELHAAGDPDVPGDELLDELRLDDAYFPAYQACLLAALARRLAPGTHAPGAHAGGTDGAARDGLRRGLGLPDDEALARWTDTNGVAAERLDELARDQAAVEWAYGWAHDEAVRRIGDHLRLRGRYRPLVDRVARRRERLAAAGFATGPVAAPVPEHDLWRWLARRHPATTHPPAEREAHARRLGFPDGAALRRAARRAYMADGTDTADVTDVTDMAGMADAVDEAVTP